jgi:hypothetical protein
MAKAGKFLGLISPFLAIGAVSLMLLVPTYAYESGGCRSSPIGQPSNPECNHESGTMSALRVALEEGDRTLLYWAGVVVVASLIAAVSALAGRAAPVWACAIVLWFLAVTGLMSLIGLSIVPLAVVLFASATLLTVDQYESRRA